MLTINHTLNEKSKWPTPKARQNIQEGLPYRLFELLQEALSLPAHQLSELAGINPRTLQRRRKEGVFTFVESDWLYRFLDLFRRTSEALESEQAAASWLKRQTPYFEGRSPLEHAATEPGYQELMQDIRGIALGSFG